MGPDSIPPRHSALGRRPDLCGPVASKHLEKAASSPSCCQLRVVPARSVLLSTGGAICGQTNLQLSKYVADRRLGRGRPSPPAPRPAPTPAVRLRSAAPTVPHAHTGHARPCAARPPSSPFASCRSPRHSSSAHSSTEPSGWCSVRHITRCGLPIKHSDRAVSPVKIFQLHDDPTTKIHLVGWDLT